MCECEAAWSEDFITQKFRNLCEQRGKNPRRAPFAIKNEIYLNDENHGWRIIVEPKLTKLKKSSTSDEAESAMRRALTFLLIFTYQIMSVVFYLILPRSIRLSIASQNDALLVDVAGMMEETNDLRFFFLRGAQQRLPELCFVWFGGWSRACGVAVVQDPLVGKQLESEFNFALASKKIHSRPSSASIKSSPAL
jgi:hypothetical protein